ncbi:Abi-alpha family protein [Brachyspira aalborgi]|uniref:Abi-alpha family protein n=1 Tax=Brachyspira aalborgi TaxID=29522 RepID=UPI001315280E|nr:Abi-alpha family protein [Brachyspira aalborgi]
MITKLLQTLFDSDNFFKDIFIRLEKEIKQENIIKEEEIEFTKILPIMDGLMLNQDNKLMGEMFYNLLKSYMDKETKDFVHPAFPQILK